MKNLNVGTGAVVLAAAAGMAWYTFGSDPGRDTSQPLTTSERHVAHAPASSDGAASVTHTAGGLQPGHALQAASQQEIIQRLQDAAVTYDPAQLPVIQPYLVDSDPALRAAAVDAMVVMGEAAAAPMLRDAAKSLASADEATQYERKAAYLELPPASSEELGAKLDRSGSE